MLLCYPKKNSALMHAQKSAGLSPVCAPSTHPGTPPKRLRHAFRPIDL
jgi:hypothetical protein